MKKKTKIIKIILLPCIRMVRIHHVVHIVVGLTLFLLAFIIHKAGFVCFSFWCLCNVLLDYCSISISVSLVNFHSIHFTFFSSIFMLYLCTLIVLTFISSIMITFSIELYCIFMAFVGWRSVVFVKHNL